MAKASRKDAPLVENGRGYIVAGWILMVVGCAASYFELDHLRIALQSEAEPTPITCEVLTQQGPSRLYVKLTDFRPYFDGAAQTMREGRLEHACVPVRPTTGERIAPKEIKVLVEISHLHAESEIKDYLDRGEVVGIIKERGTTSAYAELLQKLIPGFDGEACWTVWTETQPQSVALAGILSFVCLLFVGAGMLSLVHAAQLVVKPLWVKRYSVGLLLTFFPAGLVFLIAHLLKGQEKIGTKKGAQLLSLGSIPCLLVGSLVLVLDGLDHLEFTLLLGLGGALLALGIGLLMIGSYCRSLAEKTEAKARPGKVKALLQ